MSANVGVPVRPRLIPEHPVAWLRSRLKIYLAVLGVVVGGFFFVAGWIAAPDRHAGSGYGAALLIAALIAGKVGFNWARPVFAKLGSRWARNPNNREEEREGTAGPH